MASPHVVNIEAEIIQKLVINPPAQPPRVPEPRLNEPKLITDDVPQPIILARMMDQKLLVEYDALYGFLTGDDLKDQPLVIVSIAGAFRTGKSFLMNFFLRYLRNRGWENRDWFGDDNTAITPPGPEFFFPYKRSTEGCTKDIRVCPEVFHMPLKDERTAAVILVDTQGLYDAGLTEDSNARIMSISLLFSSLQLFNILRQMESHHLVSLQLWTSLSAASASIDSDKDKAFQDLKIVIRDYEHGEFAFGKSNNYLAKVLEGFSRIGEMDQVNQSVRRAFSGMGCFLMPHPGKGVTQFNDSGIQNKDVDEDFRKAIKELVEDVFHPANLSIKMNIEGKEAKSTDLLHLLGRVGRAYENGEAPTAETALKAAIQGNLTKALNEAVANYQKNMPEIRTGNILTGDEINTANEEAMKLVTKCFHKMATLGTEKERETFLSHLQKECGDTLKGLHKRNEEEKKNILANMDYMVINCRKRYRKAIQQQELETVTLESFQLLHETLKTENMAGFDTEMEKYEQIAPDILKLREDLEWEIHDIFTMLETKHKIQSSSYVEKSKVTIIEKFTKQVDEISHPFPFEQEIEIENFLSTLLDDCIDEFSEMIQSKTDGGHSLAAFKADLRATLVNRKEVAFLQITKKKDRLINVCQRVGRYFGYFFEDCLNEELVHGFITEDCFEGNLSKFISKYLDRSLIGNDKLPEWGKKIVRQKFEKKVAAIRKRNKESECFRSIRFKVPALSDKMLPAIRNAIKSLLRGL